MKTTMKTIFAALALVALAGPLHNAFALGGTVVSSTTIGGKVTPTLQLKPKESATWRVDGVASTGTIRLERSQNLDNWEVLGSSTASNWSGTWTGTVYSDDRTYYYRFRTLSPSSGTWITRIQDNNDFVSEIKNNKGWSILKIFDDTIVADGALHINGGGGTVPSTATTSGNSMGNTFSACLTGDTAALEGSLLISSGPVTSCNGAPSGGISVAVAPLTVDLTNWVGTAKNAVSTGNVVDVYYNGLVLMLSTGTVNVGDTVVSSNTARGRVGADSTPTTGADVGVAMSAGAAAGGTIKVRMR